MPGFGVSSNIVIPARYLLLLALMSASARSTALGASPDWSRVTPIPGSAQDQLPLQLLVPGRYAADELPLRVEGKWYALVNSGAAWAVKSIGLRVREVKNERDARDPPVPGALLEPDTPDSVILLIRGARWSRTGTASSLLKGPARMSPGDTLALYGPGADRWEILATPLSPTRYKGVYISMYEVVLRDRTSGRSQVIGGWLKEFSPEIQWVGDIDGDERIDLLLFDDSSESGSRRWELYLSRDAKGASLLEAVARLGLPGC